MSRNQDAVLTVHSQSGDSLEGAQSVLLKSGSLADPLLIRILYFYQPSHLFLCLLYKGTLC